MDEEKRMELEYERSAAKAECNKTYDTICRVRKILKDYESHWMKHKKRFESADRALAEADKVQKIPSNVKSQQSILKYTPKEIAMIAEQLGVEL